MAGPLELVGLPPLMERNEGKPEIGVALIDGPVLVEHPELAGGNIREISGHSRAACSSPSSVACSHGTFVAGLLAARRGGVALAICPGCTILVRPIFSEAATNSEGMPTATPEELAAAITDCVKAGARIINLSAALVQHSLRSEPALEQALDDAASRGTIVVAAAGNQGSIGGSSVITRHPGVIPVAACTLQGRPMRDSNSGSSIGRRGLSAPGENITSLGTNNQPRVAGGTSAAAPFVTGTIALLWSKFPKASATRIKLAVTLAGRQARRAVWPPLLDAWAADQSLRAATIER